MRISIVLCLLGLIASDVLAQSSDPPSAYLLKELQGDQSEVRMVTSQFAPNTSSSWHVHPAAVAIYVESGTGIWEIEGRPPKTVSAGQGLLEPANRKSRVSNKHAGQVLKLISFQITDPGRPFSIQYK